MHKDALNLPAPHYWCCSGRLKLSDGQVLLVLLWPSQAVDDQVLLVLLWPSQAVDDQVLLVLLYPSPIALTVNVLFIAVGVGLLVLGAQLLVSAATQIASAAGLSDLVVGLIVVAIGTSLPELATSAIAAVRGERDLAIGNIVGSNLFSIGAVVGLTALVSHTGIPVHRAAITFDLPAMLIVFLAVLPIAFTGMRIARWEGALFLTYYAAYITYLLLDATEHDALPAFSTTWLVFALPLTSVTLFLLAAHQLTPEAPRPDHTAKHHASESPDLDNPT